MNIDPESLIGKTIGGYRFDSVLGQGLMGAVFQAVSVADPTQSSASSVAIKLFSPAGTSEERAALNHRFQREIEILKGLHHPNILSILGYGEDQGYTYIVLPIALGGTLVSRMISGPMPLPEILRVVQQISPALDYAHSLGIVHRDIKPSNILLDEQNNVLLADFSIAKRLDASSTSSITHGSILGTFEYMAPEQASTDEVGPAADLYSLAVVVYQMVTGTVPFKADTSLASFFGQLLSQPPPAPRLVRTDLPSAAEAILLKALSKDPAHRFPTATAFAEALAQGFEGRLPKGLEENTPAAETVHTFRNQETIGVPPLPITFGNRRMSLLVGGLVIALIVAVLAGVLLPRLPQTVNDTNPLAITNVTATATSYQNLNGAVTPNPTTGISTSPTRTSSGSTSSTNPPQASPTSGSALPPTSQPVPSATTPSTQVSTTIRVASASISQANQFVSATVSCAGNETLLGGGANADGILYSSYPADTTTWVAEGSGLYVGQTVYAYAVCLTTNLPVSSQITQSASIPVGSNGISSGCPSGTVLTGGGFRVSPPPTPPLFDSSGGFVVVITGSDTNKSNWGTYVTGQSGETVTAYAVCLQNGPSRVDLIATTGSVPAGTTGNISLSCPASEVTTQGGGADLTTTSSQSMSAIGLVPDSNGSTWYYKPQNHNDTSAHVGQIYLLCATF